MRSKIHGPVVKGLSATLVLGLLAVAACGGDEKRVAAPTKATDAGAPVAKQPAATQAATPAPAVAVESTPSIGLAPGAKGKYDEGWKAWLSGDLQTAKVRFQEAGNADPKSPLPPYSLGVVQERLGDVPGSQLSFRNAFTISSAHEVSMCAYAISLANAGQASDADAFLNDKRAKRPNSQRLTACIGEVKSIAGEHATAQQFAQDALRIDPDFKDAMVTIARDHYRARKLDLAKYALQAILEGFGDASPARDKDNAEAHLIRGLIYREGGSRAVALSDFEAAVKKRPDLVEALINLGSMRLEAGNATEALPVLESATRFAPKSAVAHLNLGDANRLLGRFVEAKREFDTALSLDSSLAAAHYDMGLMFLTAPTIAGFTAESQVSTAIKELETYRTMRGPKAPPGVQDDIDDLITRAKAKQAELKQTPVSAPSPTPGATSKPDGGAPPSAPAGAGKK